MSRPLVLALLLGLAACATADDVPAEDGALDDSPGSLLRYAKVHGIAEGSSDAAAVLQAANGLTEAGLKADAKLTAANAHAIAAYRAGADGQAGTGDDRAIPTLKALDAIPGIGATAFTRLLAYAHAHGGVPDAGTPDASTGRSVKTVFLIVLENHGWSQIKDSASAPYLNGTLLPQASHAEAYHNPPGLHPSEPNYLWLEGGQTFGVTDDADPASNHLASHAHLTRLLDQAGVTWRAYQEDISGTSCPLAATGRYAPKHDPFVFFDDETGGGQASDAHCVAHNRPYAELAADLAAGRVARYNFITPNLCNDMHDSCAPLHDPVRQGDAWLASEVPRILASRAYQDDGLLLITWDEAASGDGPIGFLALSPLARGAGYASSVRLSHSSTLRTLEEIFGVAPLLGDAAQATDLADLFQQPAPF